MRKFTTLLVCAILFVGNVLAQQIKGDFEKWEDCYPDGTNLVGKQPIGWTASNVFQVIVGKEFVFSDAGHKGNGAKIMNDFVGLGELGANAPAFVTLGKMWVFADMMGMMMGGDDLSNGGVSGGVDFAYRPDSLTVYYKRKLGTEKPDEVAKVLVYLWKGTFKSKVISAHNMKDDYSGFKDPEYAEIDDQERAILGHKDIVPADTKGDGVLIGSADYTIDKATDADDWTRLSIPIKYVEGENGKLVPEKMNIIFSGCNYWVRADIGKENTLWVDDAALVYNAKLNSLKLDATDLIGFDSDTLEYILPFNYRNKAITAEAFGKSANVTMATIKETTDEVVKTITVSCAENATMDVNKSYTYTLTFKGESVGEITIPENMDKVYGDEFEVMFKSTNAEAPFAYVVGDEGVLKYNPDTKKFYAVGTGMTTVTARQDKEGYLPAISAPVTVNVAKASLTMTLKAWCQRGAYFDYSSSEPEADNGVKFGFSFEYEGLKNDDNIGTDIEVIRKVMGGKNIWISEIEVGKNEVVGEYRPLALAFVGSMDSLATNLTTNNYNITIKNIGAEIRKTFVTVYPSYKVGEVAYSLNRENAQGSFAVGSKVDWTIVYNGFVYGEKDAVMEELGTDLATAMCDKAPETVEAGEVVAVTVKLSQKVLANYEFKTYTGLSIKSLHAYGVENTVIAEKTYGDVAFDVPFVVKNKKGESVDYTITSSDTKIIAVKGKTATIKGAGDAYITVRVSANDEYTALGQRVDLSIAKAQFTVKAKNVDLVVGQEVPTIFDLEFEGFVNSEDSAKVFTAAPSAALEVEIPSDAKVGDSFAIIVNPGSSANYELKAVNGILKITTGSGIYDNSLSGVRAYSEDGKIYVANNEAVGMVEIYTVQGAKVYEGIDSVISTNIQKGTMYVVRIGSYATKVIVK